MSFRFLQSQLASAIFLCFSIGALAAQTPDASKPQANAAPVRVAIVGDAPSVASAVDLLTAELSHVNEVQLLERAEIEKVYREQGLSAQNRDFLRLGQVLGANGLLLLSGLTEGTNQFLQARLTAVGPGVVVSSVRSPWPVEDKVQWAGWMSRHFKPLLPKLTVLAKDAIPISIVNLRSAVRSREQEELERPLTLLAVERLVREPELFVTERQRMDVLSAEKELQGLKESAFWSASHVLDGVLDRDGYSKSTVTLNARLLASKGGDPRIIDIKGSRTNLSELVEQLTSAIRAGLKLATRDTPWNPIEASNGTGIREEPEARGGRASVGCSLETVILMMLIASPRWVKAAHVLCARVAKGLAGT